MKDKNTISSFKRGKINENETEQKGSIFAVYSNSEINEFAGVGKSKQKSLGKQNKIGKNLTSNIVLDNLEIELKALEGDKFGQLGSKVTKFIDFILYKLAEKNSHGTTNKNEINRTIEFSLTEYIKIIGKDPYDKNVRKRVKKDIDNAVLTVSSITLFKRNDKETMMLSLSIIRSFSLKNGQAIAVVGEDLAEKLIEDGYIIKIPNALFELSDKKPSAYPVGRKLCLHWGIYNNVKRGQNDKLTVKTLLKVADIQSYEEFKEKNNRNWKKIIATPFIDTLEYLESQNIITWHFERKGEKVEKKDIFSNFTYHEFTELICKYELLQSESIEEMQKKIKERQRKSKKRTKK